jgi:hypothetical protein
MIGETWHSRQVVAAKGVSRFALSVVRSLALALDCRNESGNDGQKEGRDGGWRWRGFLVLLKVPEGLGIKAGESADVTGCHTLFKHTQRNLKDAFLTPFLTPFLTSLLAPFLASLLAPLIYSLITCIRKHRLGVGTRHLRIIYHGTLLLIEITVFYHPISLLDLVHH